MWRNPHSGGRQGREREGGGDARAAANPVITCDSLVAVRMDFHGPVLRATEAASVSLPPEPLVGMLRGHVSKTATSQTIAQHTKNRVQEKAFDGERFAALHDELRKRGVRELDRLTMFLQRVADEKAVVQMLRMGSASTGAAMSHSEGSDKANESCTSSSRRVAAPAVSSGAAMPAPATKSVPAVVVGWETGWLLSRPYLSGSYLDHGVYDQLMGPDSSASGARDTPPNSSALGMVPLAQQEDLLVTDLLCTLVGVEGTHVRLSYAPMEAGSAPTRNHFVLPSPRDDTPPIDLSLAELAQQLLPLGERYVALSRFVHERSCSLESGLVMHAFCAAMRLCLQEHVVGVAQLEQQHRSEGLSMRQVWFFLQPAMRSLATLDAIAIAVGNLRGGALLRALHDRHHRLSGDVEGAELLKFLLERTAVPFFEMLSAWVFEGICKDPYGEFMIIERPEEVKNDLTTDFNCQYWQRRFYLAPAQVPAFLEPHAKQILTTGKSLHVIRECGRMPKRPTSGRDTERAFTLDERSLATRLQAASSWAASQLISLLMGEHALMTRLASVKHYFLLDQGDFFVHFLDSAEDELTKPVGEISRARLQAKLELSLRQSAVADPYRESLTCDLLPYNLTNQLLRIINASRSTRSAPPAAPQSASRTPGLDAFTFDYSVGWPLSLILSKHAITKYQLLFRHLFHCKHVERQLSSSWLSQQEPKQLVGIAAAFTASFGLRQRMLHFLFNIQHYMMFEVLEPNWHVLQQKLRAATTLDELLTHHAEFLDTSLRECMLRDAVLLKLLAKLLTICVIFADQTRIVMTDVAGHLAAAAPLPAGGPARRATLRELSAQVTTTIVECRYHHNVVKLAAKFDEELKRLLDELRRQAHREWNLAHLCARLDFNSYWTSVSHSNVGPAASLGVAAGSEPASATT